jgi:hypothetical protein
MKVSPEVVDYIKETSHEKTNHLHYKLLSFLSDW